MIYCLECMKEVYYLINCSEYRKDVEDQYILLIYYSEYRKAMGTNLYYLIYCLECMKEIWYQSILLILLFKMHEREGVPI